MVFHFTWLAWWILALLFELCEEADVRRIYVAKMASGLLPNAWYIYGLSSEYNLIPSALQVYRDSGIELYLSPT